jgi:hypothetical protein
MSALQASARTLVGGGLTELTTYRRIRNATNPQKPQRPMRSFGCVPRAYIVTPARNAMPSTTTVAIGLFHRPKPNRTPPPGYNGRSGLCTSRSSTQGRLRRGALRREGDTEMTDEHGFRGCNRA